MRGFVWERGWGGANRVGLGGVNEAGSKRLLVRFDWGNGGVTVGRWGYLQIFGVLCVQDVR